MENVREEKRETDNEEPVPTKSVKQNRISQHLLRFSVLTNVEEIFKMEKSEDKLRLFYGLKTLTLIWIILKHILFFGFHILSKK